MKIPPRIYAILAALLFGAGAPLSKMLLRDVPPLQLAGLLYLGSGLFMLLLKTTSFFREDRRLARFGKSELLSLFAAIVSGGVLAPLALMYGLSLSSAATASLLLNFETASTALLAWIFFHEYIGKRVAASIALATVASLVLSFDPSGDFRVSPGSLLVLLACVLWGIDNNFTRNISTKDPFVIVMAKGLFAGSFSFALSLMIGFHPPSLTNAGLSLLLGGLSYGMSLLLFIFALRELGSARTSVLFASAPFLGAGMSLLLFREAPTAQFLISVPLLIAGLALLFRESHGHMHEHEPLEHTHMHSHNDGHHDGHHHDQAHGHSHDHHDDHGHGHSLDACIGKEMYHTHSHHHEATLHNHNHLPDLHHRHSH